MVRVAYAPLPSGSSDTQSQSFLVRVQDLSRILVFFMSVCCGVMFSITFSAIRQSRSPTRGPMVNRFQSEQLLQSDSVEGFRKTHSMNETFHKGEGLLAEELSRAVRVLCVVLTTESDYKSKGDAVKNTWGSHCNTLLFVSNFENSELPVVKMYAGKEGTLQVWALVKSAMNHVYLNHLRDHDWVLRAEDSTFVVLENLRYLLSQYNPADALYLGCRYKKYVTQGFMSGGAGYVLSKEAVNRMVHDGIPSGLCSVQDGGAEDVEMGKCMEALAVRAVDTRDALGRGRFFPFTPERFLVPDNIEKDNWYWDMVYYPPTTGYNCCSDTAISFYGLNPEGMYVLNYLIYHLRPYGINHHFPVNQLDASSVIK